MEPSLQDHERRLVAMEQHRNSTESNFREVRRDISLIAQKIEASEIHRDYINQRFDSMEKTMEAGFGKQNAIITRVAWVLILGIGGAFGGALVKFIIEGGLASV